MSYKSVTRWNLNQFLARLIAVLFIWSHMKCINASRIQVKEYVTIVKLVKTKPYSIFSKNLFRAAVKEFYENNAGVPGFISISNIQHNSSTGKVEYTLKYSLLELLAGNFSDNDIYTILGNYNFFKSELNSSFHFMHYTFPENGLFIFKEIHKDSASYKRLLPSVASVKVEKGVPMYQLGGVINGGGKGGKELDQQTKILLLIIAVLVAGGIYHWYQQHQKNLAAATAAAYSPYAAAATGASPYAASPYAAPAAGAPGFY